MTDQTKASQNTLVAAYKQGVADFPRCYSNKYQGDEQAAYLRGYHSTGDYFDEVRPDAEAVKARRARLSAANIGEAYSAGYRGK